MNNVKDLYYVIEENGYHIYDRNNPNFHVYQFEPDYIPDPSKSYEENAIAQIAELTKPYDPMDNEMYAAGYEQALLDMLEDEEV